MTRISRNNVSYFFHQYILSETHRIAVATDIKQDKKVFFPQYRRHADAAWQNYTSNDNSIAYYDLSAAIGHIKRSTRETN